MRRICSSENILTAGAVVGDPLAVGQGEIVQGCWNGQASVLLVISNPAFCALNYQLAKVF